MIKNVDISFDKLSVRLCFRALQRYNIRGIAEVLFQTLQSITRVGTKLAYIKDR